ncbi:cytochrome P450 [Aspergillus bertholletiae]|uniref:Cytochrome P450 n=1 Tax=Aspergillus bertholletiae TaxID=1226010 RepID=A0A5N7BHE3_9EURO|nr:cytochrome P450 [Aspergillus bertholletiae]
MSLLVEYFPDSSIAFCVTVAASLVFICYMVFDTVYNLSLSPLASFPGPKLWAVSNIPRQVSILGGRSHLTILALHNRYGPVVRTGPNELSFNNPQGFRDIYGLRHGQPPFRKDPEFYGSPLNGIGNSIGGDIDIAFHSRQSLREQEQIVVYYVDLLIQRLRERTNINEMHSAEEDIKIWFNFITFDIIGDLMFAESFDCLKDSQLHPWIACIFDNVKGIALLGVLNQYPLFRRIHGVLLPKSLKRKLLEHQNLCVQKTGCRLQRGASRPDFVTQSSDMDSLTIAGSETTAALLSGCLYYICKHTYIMNQLCKEIRTAFSRDEEITSSKCFGLKYLNAVLEESLRMYPPVAGNLPRLVPKGGSIINGHFIPGDVTVSTHQYASYHSPTNFALPEQFIPERWLGTDNRFDPDKRGVLQPFILGPRNCLGKKLAYMEMRLILSKLVFNFDIDLAPLGDNWNEQKGFIVWDRPPLMVRLVDRFA